MQDSLSSYPFPVLGNGDDIAGIFSPTMLYTLGNMITIDIQFELQHISIESLIKEKKAAFFVEIQCGSTFFRQIYQTFERKYKVEINSKDLRDSVSVNFYICAIQPIFSYNPEGVHSDLAGDAVSVEAGDIIADGGTSSFIADKTFDPLKAPVSSFMKIMENPNIDEQMNINYEQNDRIVLELSKKDFTKYNNVKGRAVASIHSSIVLVALVDVIYTMNSEIGKRDYGESAWFNKIQEICRYKNIDLDNPLITAQKLLGNPLERSLSETERLLENED
jgi:hypothetical protein